MFYCVTGTGESVQSCVSNCCLLAKFLGLIVFSPYICETPLNPTTLQAQIQIRQQVEISAINGTPGIKLFFLEAIVCLSELTSPETVWIKVIWKTEKVF